MNLSVPAGEPRTGAAALEALGKEHFAARRYEAAAAAFDEAAHLIERPAPELALKLARAALAAGRPAAAAAWLMPSSTAGASFKTWSAAAACSRAARWRPGRGCAAA